MILIFGEKRLHEILSNIDLYVNNKLSRFPIQENLLELESFFSKENFLRNLNDLIRTFLKCKFLKMKKEKAATKVAWRVLRFILMGPMMMTAATEQLPQQNAQQKWTQRSKLINTTNAIILPVY
uniref:Uncharacterized protein n=1 Tax=Rhizophagus irregularis (strain DAOM 181602 / DAOM 197198 / MUCL 43194) TaxID=747089 RepID=U9TTK9_RHIID